ncbi:MAG: hypothetical protein QOD72_747 [Acidimicrobiaceae bacterium]|jgi:hypothetical protein|nr:hypothetical protein [Acidimicrobiaceae bacterium]
MELEVPTCGGTVSDSNRTMGVTVVDQDPGCRSERASPVGSKRWLLPAAGFVLFVLGFWTARSYVRSRAAADDFAGFEVDYDLWAALMGAMGGFALAACAYFVIWLVGIRRLFRSRPGVRAELSWVASVLIIEVVVFGSLLIAGSSDKPSIDTSLAMQTRPVIFAAAALVTTGLVAFMALRSVAVGDENWLESGLCRVRLVIRLRAELRRLLATFGAFLTLIVVATGMRRRALLAANSNLLVPPEQVVLYGLVFAVMLGLFYATASSAIDNRAQQLLDEFAPLPNPADEKLSDQLRRRNDVTSLIGGGGSWRTFETTVVIAAPLLSALIGIATGK